MYTFFYLFSPEIVIMLIACLCLFSLLIKKIFSFCYPLVDLNLKTFIYFFLISILVVLYLVILDMSDDKIYIYSLLLFNKGLLEFKIFFILLNIFYFLTFSPKLFTFKSLEIFYFFVFMFIFSIFIAISSNNLFLILLCLEIQNFITYFLMSFQKHNKKSSQSVFTYFVLNSLLSFFFLICIIYFYYIFLTNNLSELQVLITNIFDNSSSSLFWSTLVIILLLFLILLTKLALVPFQFWIKEVYSGMSFSLLGFLNLNLKLVLFYLLIHFIIIFNNVYFSFYFKIFLLFIGSLTLIIGCILTLYQKTIKFFLICSSITHTGYIIIIMSQYSDFRYLAAMFCYILFYILTLSILWSILSYFSEQEDQSDFFLSELTSIFTYFPNLGFIFSLCIISLAGLPPFIGFFFKYFLFSTISESGISGLSILYFLIISAITCFYYLYILKVIFFDPLPKKQAKLKYLFLSGIESDRIFLYIFFLVFSPFIYGILISISYSFSLILFL